MRRRRSPTLRWGSADQVSPELDVLNTRVRCHALTSEHERRSVVAARLLLLGAVTEHTGCAAGEVVLSQHCATCGGQHGQPSVSVRGKPGPYVSIAHSGSLAVVAVDDHPVGVDVECGDRHEWTRIEAVLKSTGLGLEVDPSMLDVDATGSIVWRGPGRRPRVCVHDVAIASGYAASVACRGRRSRPIDIQRVELARSEPR